MIKIRYVNKAGLIVETAQMTERDALAIFAVLLAQGIKHMKIVTVKEYK